MKRLLPILLLPLLVAGCVMHRYSTDPVWQQHHQDLDRLLVARTNGDQACAALEGFLVWVDPITGELEQSFFGHRLAFALESIGLVSKAVTLRQEIANKVDASERSGAEWIATYVETCLRAGSDCPDGDRLLDAALAGATARPVIGRLQAAKGRLALRNQDVVLATQWLTDALPALSDPTHLWQQAAWVDLSRIDRWNDRPGAAAKKLQRVLQARAGHGPDPTTVHLYRELAAACVAAERLADARFLLEDVLVFLQQQEPPVPQSIAVARMDLARVMIETRSLDEAKRHLTLACATFEARAPEDRVRLEAEQALVSVEAALGEVEQARIRQQDVVAVLEASVGPAADATLRAKLVLARIEALLGLGSER